jgi:hypothetical protein
VNARWPTVRHPRAVEPRTLKVERLAIRGAIYAFPKVTWARNSFFAAEAGKPLGF